MPPLGAHMSIGGGLPRAVDRARAAECGALQIFTKNASQWRARSLPLAEIDQFRRKVRDAAIARPVAHSSYLINVAASPGPLRLQSIAALGEEIDRAEALGLYGLVMHPGCYTSGTESAGLRLIAEALRQLLANRPRKKTRILLELTAGQGTSLGHRFEHLSEIIDRLAGSPRVGVCLDTCHLLAAGYDICSRRGYEATFDAFDSIVGFDRLQAFHVNDSKRPCASRVDRHEHIGRGCIGLEPFRWLLNDARFQTIPMILETPKSELTKHTRREVDPFDKLNLATLRRLLKNTSPPRTPRPRIARCAPRRARPGGGDRP